MMARRMGVQIETIGGGVSATGVNGRLLSKPTTGESVATQFRMIGAVDTAIAIIEHPWQCSIKAPDFFEASGALSEELTLTCDDSAWWCTA